MLLDPGYPYDPGVNLREVRIWAILAIVFAFAGHAFFYSFGQILLLLTYLVVVVTSHLLRDPNPTKPHGFLFYLGLAVAVYYVSVQLLVTYHLPPPELRFSLSRQYLPPWIADRFPLDNFLALLTPFFAPLVAWGLRERLSSVRFIMLSLVVIMVVALALNLKWPPVSTEFYSGRGQSILGFNPIHESLLYALTLVILLIYLLYAFVRFIQEFRHTTPTGNILKLLWLLLLSLSAYLISQALIHLGSRGVWLGLLASFVVAIVFLIFHKRSRTFQSVTLGTALLVVVGLIALTKYEPVRSRLQIETIPLSILNHDLLSEKPWVPPDGNIDSSFETRAGLIHLAFLLIKQRPLFGWGLDTEHLIAHNQLYPTIAEFHSFHNSYLGLVVRVGLVGLLFHLALYVRLGWGVVNLVRISQRSPNLLSLYYPLLFASLFTLNWVGYLTNSTLFVITGRSMDLLLGGLLLATEAYGRRAEKLEKESRTEG